MRGFKVVTSVQFISGPVLTLDSWERKLPTMTSVAPQLSTEADRRQVIAVTDQELAAMSTGNVAQYFAILAEDAVFMPPNTSAIQGPELRAWVKEFLEHFSVEWTTIAHGETVVNGNLAYHDYTYSMKSTPKAGGEPVIGHGKGLHVLRREAQGWKIVREVWNAVPPR